MDYKGKSSDWLLELYSQRLRQHERHNLSFYFASNQHLPHPFACLDCTDMEKEIHDLKAELMDRLKSSGR